MPPTPLLTSDVLKEENEQWPDVQQGMSLALREMRVDQVRLTVKIVKSRDKISSWSSYRTVSSQHNFYSNSNTLLNVEHKDIWETRLTHTDLLIS